MPKKKILFLSRWFPIPMDNGSKLRIYNLLRGLAHDYDIMLISFDDSTNTDRNISEIIDICTDIKTVPLNPFNPHSLQAQLGYLSPTPRSNIDTYSHEMARQIKVTIASQNPDLVIASQVSTASYRPIFRLQPALFEEVEIGLLYDGFLNTKSLMKRWRKRLTWMKHHMYLANLLRSFEACTVVSEREKQLLVNLGLCNPIPEVIPNCININDYQDIKHSLHSNTLIFTGSFSYYPNYEAMIWFIKKVFHLIQAKYPSIQLIITGNHMGQPLPQAYNVSLTGFVDDVRPLIAGSSICVVPIFSGGGTRLKILEAMALHKPVVSTHKGVEGLDVRHGFNILIADNPEEFAGYIIELLDDPEKSQKLADNAYQLVQEKYEWSVVMPRFLNLIESTFRKRSSRV